MMADLTITAAGVEAGTGARVDHGTAGASVTAGQTVYLDPSDNSYKLADCDSGTEEARSTTGIALHAAATGQPLAVHTKGPLTIGATVTAGVAYYQSATAGGVCPVADLGSGDYPVFLGFATSASVIDVDIKEAGVALA
jgi:hypothetical protein